MTHAFIIICLLSSASSSSTFETSNRNVPRSLSQDVRRGLTPNGHTKRPFCNEWLCRNSASNTALASVRGRETYDETSLGAPASESLLPSKLESLLSHAKRFISQRDTSRAFAVLMEAYPLDPTSSQIAAMFQSCMEINVEVAHDRFHRWRTDAEQENRISFSEEELTNLFQDRMGLASLFIDKEKYDQAGSQLRNAIEESSVWLNHALSGGRHDKTDGINVSELDTTQFKHWKPQIDHAQYLLYRTNSACCKWDTYFQDGDRLRDALTHKTSPSGSVIRLLHPFDALKFPCVSLDLASKIAQSYAHRALESVGVPLGSDFFKTAKDASQPREVVTAVRPRAINDNSQLQRKIRVGYLSPDFTSRHPLAFLMQHVFRCHDKSRFSVHTYSLNSNEGDEGPEVQAIREASDSVAYLSPSRMSPMELYQRIMQDELDILVDLCGYAGTSLVAEIMASRCKLQHDNGNRLDQRFPIHISYMGFPGSVGSSRVWDYSVFDEHVIPPSARKHYTEALVFMPHCYFVNSHRTVVGGPGDGILLANDTERIELRKKYGIHPSAFVYCCHSRPDKIDPLTFRSWMRALCIVREEHKKKEISDDSLPVLWLLRSGDEMENNLRSLVRCEFGDHIEDALVFADVSERKEHLKRLGCADLFLDTPAYNAHTLGCDALYIGVPMISLLHGANNTDSDNIANADDESVAAANLQSDSPKNPNRLVATDKLASKVGASLLYASSCEEFIVHDMQAYEDLMVECSINQKWFDAVRGRLRASRHICPLFDTFRWVKNLETAFLKMMTLDVDDFPDIVVFEE
ncbi:hypothetical protein HJC23_002084 [Cyclotella cryptica]|uniref:O-GlcNAc transferase C-terminal domain-containing protein n=1 Tax=Cyclotella cryptica TaxID=29204 RepID=A0ABD3P5W5_9STRA|eukprot:CCRYP_017101-RA/>CCRYP_017101-RA protein AED:0.06 eAED:0.06 QI:0/-1/0/1/-1/1/1/0/804